MAMATVVLGFAYVFADAGLSNAVVYKQHSSRNILSTLYWTNVLVGVALAACLWLVSPLAGLFYRDPAVVGLLRLAAYVLPVVALGQLPLALLERDLAFRRIAPIEIASAVVGIVVAIGTAALGQGPRSFVWGQLATAAVRSLGLLGLVWRTWRPSLHFARSDLRGYLGFGAYQLGERTVNYWAANVDYLVVGRFLGPESLGPYTVAYQLAAVPMQRMNPVLTRVAFPVLARTQSDSERLLRGYLKLVKAVAFLSFPLLAGLAVCASIAVPLIAGGGWLQAVPIVQVLCVMGAMKVLASTTGSLLLAKGRADVGFWWNVFTMVVTATCLILVVSEGILMVALAQAVLSIIFLALLLGILKRVSGLSVTSFVGAAARPLVATGIMATAVAAVLIPLGMAALPAALTLSCCAFVGAASYGLAWRLLEKGYIRSMWREMIGSQERSS